jgi:hypothetical protein
LRENLSVFEINDKDNKVTFLSEKKNFITCEYSTEDGKMTLTDFVLEDLNSVTDDERIDSQVSEQVGDFVTALSHDRFDTAESTFDNILEAFTTRHRIKETRSKLDKKCARFNSQYNIIDALEYSKLEEVAPMLEKFLTENKDALASNNTFMEGMRLSHLVSEAYDMPHMSYEDLESAFIIVPENNKKTLYEMICEKELVRKELLEAKESFSRMWVGNDSITNLASNIYAKDPTIVKGIKECVKNLPYFALANKTDVYEVLNSVYEVTNPGTISQKDIREFVNKVFEMKKPHKQTVLTILNEKYGVNMQNLKFVPSFRGLAEVYSDVLNILSEEAGEGVLCDVTKEFATFIKKKGGVEVLDVANFIQESCQNAGLAVITSKEDFGIEALSAEISEQYEGDEEQDMKSKDLEKKPKKKSKKGKVEKVGGDDTEATATDDVDAEPGEGGDAEPGEGGDEEDESEGTGDKFKKKKKPNEKGGKEEVKGDKKKLKEAAVAGSEETEEEELEDEVPQEEEAEGEQDIKGLVSELESMLGEIDLGDEEFDAEEFDAEEDDPNPGDSPA